MHLFQPGAGSLCLLGPLGSTRGLLGRTHTHTHVETRAHARRHRNRPTNSGAHSLDLDEHGPACTCVHMRIKHANRCDSTDHTGGHGPGRGLAGRSRVESPNSEGKQARWPPSHRWVQDGGFEPTPGCAQPCLHARLCLRFPHLISDVQGQESPQKASDWARGPGGRSDSASGDQGLPHWKTLCGGFGGFTENNNKGMGGVRGQGKQGLLSRVREALLSLIHRWGN